MYKYTSKSLFDNPITYSYSTYEGGNFIKDWEIHRLSYCKELTEQMQFNNKSLISPRLPTVLLSEDSNIGKKYLSDFLLSKYESTKRIYSEYINTKPTKVSGYKNIENYISTAFLIERSYSNTKDIRYLNCLLKLCDLFQSDKIFFLYSSYIKELVSKEIYHISVLHTEKLNIKLKPFKISEKQLKVYESPQRVNGLILICCNSSRSSIYLQSLINANIYPDYIIYMSKNKTKEKFIRYRYKKLNFSPDWLYVPKEYIHPIELARENNIKFIEIETISINSNIIRESLNKLKVKQIIYCGFSGEIVSQELINRFNFMHCHAGTLPRFRGSTTFYYEILSKHFPSVSCILLDKTIDTGPIIAIKSFPIPCKTDDIDSLYEPSIRANLLCDVLFDSGISINLNPKPQFNTLKRLNYYVIHPVLKHISFSLFRDQ